MKMIRPAMLSLALLVMLAQGGQTAPRPMSRAYGHLEPGGPLDAGASLVEVLDTGGSPRAVVRLDLLSHRTDAEATVLDPSRRPLARTSLKKGEALSINVGRDLQPDRENHLFYIVKARGADGSLVETSVYVRVNLDKAREPELNGDYLEYQGGAASEVEP